MIGKLDRRITIIDYTTTTNAFGEKVQSWTTTKTVWAQVKFTSGGERFEAKKVTEVNNLVFTIRYDAVITSKAHVIYNGKVYGIESVFENQSAFRRTYTDLITRSIENLSALGGHSMDDFIIIKGHGNTGATDEEGDWKIYSEPGGTLQIAKYVEVSPGVLSWQNTTLAT